MSAASHSADSGTAAQASPAIPRPIHVKAPLVHAPSWHTYWTNPGDSGLPTRLFFEERLAQAAKRCDAKRSRLAVLFVDLDRFKSVNDTFGEAMMKAIPGLAKRLEMPYEIVETIGKGGMGAVYKVEQVFLKKEFALKTFGGTFNEHQARRFQTEAKATSKLDHPNIVRVSDFGLIDN